MEPPPEITQRLRTCLEKHTPTLREALRAALTERTFPPHPRFKGREAPALDEHDSVCGIHVEYEYPGWVPYIFGLSRAGAIKCGGRHPFLGGSVVEAELEEIDDGGTVENWIRSAWRAVRGVAPELRGYVSIHDTLDWVDMDTGATVPENVRGMGWL